jgi:flagellar L-ring protein FlgH
MLPLNARHNANSLQIGPISSRTMDSAVALRMWVAVKRFAVRIAGKMKPPAMRRGAASILAAIGIISGQPSMADNLFVPGISQSLSSDKIATSKGDLITVVVVQAAESTTSIQRGSQKSSSVNGHLGIGSINETADFGLSGSYSGRGESRRTERFVTQLTATVTDVLPNGDFLIGGAQRMNIDGEATMVEVRGRIRPRDIDAYNRVPSNRIADAQISYDGKGFASQSARPGLIQRIFGFLGLN